MNTRILLVCGLVIGGGTSLQGQSTKGQVAGDVESRPVTVTMSHGSIDVVGTSASSVSYELRGIRHDSSVVIVGNTWNRELTYGNAVRIDVTPPPEAGLRALQLRVSVPRTLKLLHLQLTGGMITVNGFDGDLTVESDSGMVRGTQLGGGVVIETRDGGIDITMSGAVPRHAVSLLARNGTITLAVPANGLVPFDLPISCGFGGMGANPGDESKAIEALGIHRGSGGCDATSDVLENGAKISQVGQQSLNSTWTDGGAVISLRTLRGSIVLSRR